MAGEILLPGADIHLLPNKSHTPIIPRIVNIHTMAGTMGGTQSLFQQTGKPYSHLGLSYLGWFRQWQDMRYRAASDLNGNPYSISIETEDKGLGFPQWTGSDVPYWTSQQVEALVVALAWLCARFRIPPVLLQDSRLQDGHYGVSYHRLGIDPWRVPGGILYSSSYGKACPGSRRIEQLHGIVARVAQILNPPPPQPEPEPVTEEEDMYRLIRRQSTTHTYLVHGENKLWIRNDDEMNAWKNVFAVNHIPLDVADDGGPIIWYDWMIDSFKPLRPEDNNPVNPQYPYRDGNGALVNPS